MGGGTERDLHPWNGRPVTTRPTLTYPRPPCVSAPTHQSRRPARRIETQGGPAPDDIRAPQTPPSRPSRRPHRYHHQQQPNASGTKANYLEQSRPYCTG